MVWKWATPGKHFGLVAVPADNAAAVTENTDDAAVFPVGRAVLEGQLQNTQKVLDNIRGNLKFDAFFVLGPLFGLLLQVGHEARPRPGLKLVQQRGFMFCHLLTSIVFRKINLNSLYRYTVVPGGRLNSPPLTFLFYFRGFIVLICKGQV